jgi:ribokinase
VGAACIGTPTGNLLVSTEGELWLSHLRVDVVDTTGAGDAFAAALAVGLAEGQSVQNAARFANAVAALATTKLGAQSGFPHRAEVLAFMSH